MATPKELSIGLIPRLAELSSPIGLNSPAKSRPTDLKYKHARLLIEGKTPANLLAEKIREEGRVMEGKLKVNSFLNHQVDCHLMSVCGHEIARRFRGLNITKVFTGFGSGLMPAQSCAMHMRIPLVFATDPSPMVLPGVVVHEAKIGASSAGRTLPSMYVSSEFLSAGDTLLVIDDMLSKGGTIVCLAELAAKAGATIVAVGFLIEKEYEGGRAILSKALNLPASRVQSLVRIKSITNGIELADDE